MGTQAIRIIQTIASTRLDHGGTSRSVPALCDALIRKDCDSHLITAVPYQNSMACNLPEVQSRVHLARESALVRQFGVSKQFVNLLAGLSRGRERETIVHDHAIWLPTNHAVAAYCRRRGIRRVVSPRGMLGHWAMSHGQWKKSVAWKLYQRLDLLTATAFHATSEQEAAEIRALGFRQPIAVVPNGISIPESLPKRSSKQWRQALFLSRIHPKKGLINLVRAWHELGDLASPWHLVIAGPDEKGYRAVVEREVARLGLEDRIRFVGNVEGDVKWQLYIDSDLFILPSFNENYGIVIAEALAVGLPVITTQETPWKAILDKQLGWWIPPTLESLIAALREALCCSDAELQCMGHRARDFARSSSTWASAAEKLLSYYSSL